MTSKVFGIISYFPDNDSGYHIETRRERSRRCSELLFKLEELWPDIDIIIIAQNWKDIQLPEIKNKITRYDYPKLGIVGARKTLREKFLESDYDYLIMLDDDGIIEAKDPSIYMREIDNHPNGIGVIRHNSCSMMLLAISKYIYSRIDIPDIRSDLGEGFEDDLFVANCFAKFPDKAFDFSKDCVTEISFRYDGEGACPSTWAHEKEYDWNAMRKLTRKAIDNLSIVKTYNDSDFIPSIDAVIPFVDCTDKQWISDFNKTTGIYSSSGVRFRSWDTLKYLIRGISKYMPFIKRIILIISRESQLPKWVNQENIKIIYHREFIPKEFLPTFNSCTIESFLYKISDLSDKFIYFNDDMFPISQMGLSDFFDGDIPIIDFVEHIQLKTGNMYEGQCRSGLDMLSYALGIDRYPAGEIAKPEHCPVPMLKSTLNYISENCANSIAKTISTLRQYKNVNQYIYSYYQFFTNQYVQGKYRFLYVDIDDSLSRVTYALRNEDFQMICINDSDKIKDYKKAKSQLIKLFEEKFPDKSKYEI